MFNSNDVYRMLTNYMPDLIHPYKIAYDVDDVVCNIIYTPFFVVINNQKQSNFWDMSQTKFSNHLCTECEFHLQKNVKFIDNSSVKYEDIKYSITCVFNSLNLTDVKFEKLTDTGLKFILGKADAKLFDKITQIPTALLKAEQTVNAWQVALGVQNFKVENWTNTSLLLTRISDKYLINNIEITKDKNIKINDYNLVYMTEDTKKQCIEVQTKNIRNTMLNIGIKNPQERAKIVQMLPLKELRELLMSNNTSTTDALFSCWENICFKTTEVKNVQNPIDYTLYISNLLEEKSDMFKKYFKEVICIDKPTTILNSDKDYILLFATDDINIDNAQSELMFFSNSIFNRGINLNLENILTDNENTWAVAVQKIVDSNLFRPLFRKNVCKYLSHELKEYILPEVNYTRVPAVWYITK